MTKPTALAGPGTIEKLAAWALAPQVEDIPRAALTQAKLLLLDTIGWSMVRSSAFSISTTM